MGGMGKGRWLGTGGGAGKTASLSEMQNYFLIYLVRGEEKKTDPVVTGVEEKQKKRIKLKI